MKGYDSKPERIVDVALLVTEPGSESKVVVNSQSTYASGDRRARNRAKASERLHRPEGTRVTVIDSGPAGALDYLLEND